jgi:hypothetical protein
MKKIYYVPICILFITAITSCGGGDSPVGQASGQNRDIKEIPTIKSNEIVGSLPLDQQQPIEKIAPKTTLPIVSPTPIPTETPIKILIATPTAVPTPLPTPTSTPMPTPIPYIFDEFGFSLEIDEDTNLRKLLSIDGLLETTADETQGILAFEYNGVDASLMWSYDEGESTEELVETGFYLLTDSQPDNIFIPINDGEIEIDNRYGSFGGFLVSNPDMDDAEGGLIAAWNCDEVNYTLLTTGADSTSLQIRFDKIISGFTCKSMNN